MPRLSLGLVAFLAAIPPLAAQGQWSLRSTPTAPDLFSPRMTFDSPRNVTVAMGFSKSVGNFQTWEWNGTAWSLRHAMTSPLSFFGFGTLAFDAVRGVSTWVGGGSFSQNSMIGSQVFHEWDGANLILPNPPQLPGRRTRAATAFDTVRGRLVVFGGGEESGTPILGTTVLRDTWEWDGSAWIQRNPLAAPMPRWGHAMSFDAVRRRVVLFGGTTRTLVGNGTYGTTLQDLWEYDGTIWVERTTLVAPPARHGHGMATDPARGITYVYGGLDDRGMPLADLWAWDGTRWRELFTPQMPGRRWDFALAFDAQRGRLILHGGTGVTRESLYPIPSPAVATYQRDLWEYTPGTSGSYTPFGSGCAGVQGVPAISARGGEVPTAGATFTVQVNHLPLTGAAWIFLGNSKTQYGALTLPFDLGAIGMQGCALRVSGDFLYPVTNVLGAGLWTIPIPADAAGLRFFNQAIVLDPSANSLGLTVSNGAEAVIGG